MYKLHLIRKYLLKRRIAWVSLIAVMLCTAMVLVVISVMGGWLQMFKDSFRGMDGDLTVTGNSLVGFPYYDDMIKKITALPAVTAAVPIIRSAGLINLSNQIRDVVEVVGLPLGQIGQVTEFPKSLYRQYDQRKQQLTEQADKPGISADEKARLLEQIEHPTPSFALLPEVDYKDKGPRASHPENRPGIIISDPVAGIKSKEPPPEFLYDARVTLTLVPVSPDEMTKVESATTIPCWVVDSAHPKIFTLDSNRVYLDFDELQNDLRMDANNGEPARVSEIEIKARPGADLIKLRDEVADIVRQVRMDRAIDPEYMINVKTWQQQQGSFIDAVEHEVVLTTMLFGIISLVAVFLIFCIFYMIVVEKTKDIGIIKSVGATGWGVAQIFLGYGLAIGIVGAGMGLVAAFLIVRYINELHAWLGRVMGIVIWNPETYQFDHIPNRMEWHTVGWIMIVAVLSALLGAVVPALRAASMNPVEALRYE